MNKYAPIFQDEKIAPILQDTKAKKPEGERKHQNRKPPPTQPKNTPTEFKTDDMEKEDQTTTHTTPKPVGQEDDTVTAATTDISEDIITSKISQTQDKLIQQWQHLNESLTTQGLTTKQDFAQYMRDGEELRKEIEAIGNRTEYDIIKQTADSQSTLDQRAIEIITDIETKATDETAKIEKLQHALHTTMNQTLQLVQKTYAKAKRYCQFAVRSSKLTPEEAVEVMSDDDHHKQQGQDGLVVVLA